MSVRHSLFRFLPGHFCARLANGDREGLESGNRFVVGSLKRGGNKREKSVFEAIPMTEMKITGRRGLQDST
ncbi:hypothetical protein CEXT_610701 [Caerostris extrusa]|uniref:Uncharacterized protein n=1 Tax=Caerostris extrusa TaxID=172846 RepID=A0AAV4N5E6_CAEEX|nr:hypothetical protein CEXT_610701 [Caerostris extrusa]